MADYAKIPVDDARRMAAATRTVELTQRGNASGGNNARRRKTGKGRRHNYAVFVLDEVLQTSAKYAKASAFLQWPTDIVPAQSQITVRNMFSTVSNYAFFGEIDASGVAVYDPTDNGPGGDFPTVVYAIYNLECTPVEPVVVTDTEPTSPFLGLIWIEASQPGHVNIWDGARWIRWSSAIRP